MKTVMLVLPALFVVMVLSGCVKTKADSPAVNVNPVYAEEIYYVDNVLAAPASERSAAIRKAARSGELKHAESFVRLARGIFRPPTSLLPRHQTVKTCEDLAYGFLDLPLEELTADNADQFLAELWPGHKTRVAVILIESGRLPQDVHDRVMYYYEEELDMGD